MNPPKAGFIHPPAADMYPGTVQHRQVGGFDQIRRPVLPSTMLRPPAAEAYELAPHVENIVGQAIGQSALQHNSPEA